ERGAVRTDSVLHHRAAATVVPREKPRDVEQEAHHHGDLDDGPDEVGPGHGHTLAVTSLTEAAPPASPTSAVRMSFNLKKLGSSPSARASARVCSHAGRDDPSGWSARSEI